MIQIQIYIYFHQLIVVALMQFFLFQCFHVFFLQLFDWSKSEAGNKERLLTFYRLSDCIAERLKGLFVLFAGNLVKAFADLLRQTNISKTGEPGILFYFNDVFMC